MPFRVVQPWGKRPGEWTVVSEHRSAREAFDKIDALSAQTVPQAMPAIDTHYNVAKVVREAVKQINGTMPEDLPREVPIKTLEGALREPSLLDEDGDDEE